MLFLLKLVKCHVKSNNFSAKIQMSNLKIHNSIKTFNHSHLPDLILHLQCLATTPSRPVYLPQSYKIRPTGLLYTGVIKPFSRITKQKRTVQLIIKERCPWFEKPHMQIRQDQNYNTSTTTSPSGTHSQRPLTLTTEGGVCVCV